MTSDQPTSCSAMATMRRHQRSRLRLAASVAILATPLALCLTIARAASAEMILYEGFDYEAGALEGNDGGEGAWSGAWQHSGGFFTGSDWQVDASGLSYTDAGGRTLVTTGGAARADAGGGSQEFPATRAWDTTGYMDDGDALWFSYLFNHASGDTGDMRVFVLGDTFRRGVGPFISSNNTQIEARIQTSTSSIANDGFRPFVHDEDQFLVGRITFSDTSGEDELRYWLNPELNAVLLDTDLNSGAVTGSVSANWSDFFMRHSGGNSDLIDEIRIGTEPADVGMVVPEPSSLALLGVGGLLLMRWCRRT